MTLAAENIALKAQNARLREALTVYADQDSWRDNPDNPIYPDYMDLWTYDKAPGFELAQLTLAQPTPTTPETDKAQAVIEAAYAVVDNPMFAGMCDQDCALMAAVEAYRGGA